MSKKSRYRDVVSWEKDDLDNYSLNDANGEILDTVTIDEAIQAWIDAQPKLALTQFQPGED